ncbi:hypothetical protein HB364_13860 [Pseudoflavitalea sp. X16]|uniref:hypothetical protein n=1 Tax=Paraflavitalea devenefica TaxID=2716334 RepID=UPI00142486B2|nr:hypothetical protein [Paraflavitalea devenefica]NII26174.1 hypothetical protein [Paraflavitalea devenefica]
MLELHNRYLLLVECGDANTAEHNTLDYQTASAATLHEALLHLFKIPPDQFHPDAAILNDQPWFVKKAHILDLVDGTPVIHTLHEPHPKQPAFDGILLVIVEGIPVSALKAQLGEPSNRTSLDQPAIFDFLKWDRDAEHMVPTPVFSQLFSAAVHMSIAGTATLIPHQFAYTLEGFKIKADADPDGHHFAPAFTEHHYFETLAHAVIKLLLTPSSRFSYTQSRQNGALTFYDNATISPLPPATDKPLASCYLQPPAHQQSAPNTPVPGRYLEFGPTIAEVLQRLGIEPAYFNSIGDRQTLQLDQYSRHATDTLALLEHLQVPTVGLMYAFGPQGPTLDYEAVVGHRIALPAPLGEGQHNALVEQIIHTHTNDPLLALFQMISHPVAVFDEIKPDTTGFQITQASIIDSEKTMVLTITSQPPDTERMAPGLYLAVAPQLMIHPTFRHLHPGQLAAGGAAFQQHGALLYIPIAYPEEGGLRISPGYQGFSATALAHYFIDQLGQRPEMQKFASKTLEDDTPYLVTQTWVIDTGHLTDHFTIVRASQDPISSLRQIARLAPELFTPKPLGDLGIPMRLVSANLVQRQQGEQQTLVRKFGHPLDESRFNYSLHSKDPIVTAAFTEVFGGEHLKAAIRTASRLDRIERMFRSTPPGPSQGLGP